MRFEWDEAKNAENIRKHGIDFVDVSAMFGGPMLIELDEGEDYGEDRWIGVGFLLHIVAVVVWTELQDDVIHFISARKATQYERKRFEQDLTY